MSMNTKVLVAIGLLIEVGIGLITGVGNEAVAGLIEVSAGLSFSQNMYSDVDYNWSRRWGASLGYYVSDITEFELSFQDNVDRTVMAPYQDTTFHDQVVGLNVIQYLAGKNFAVQPYVKLGIGQLNREASGTDVLGGTPPTVYDSVTGIIGAGLKIYLTKTFGIRGEATSYLIGGNISTWKQNNAVTLGVSIYF